MSAKHAVRLRDREREQLQQLTHSGNTAARKLIHAHILLKVDANGDAWNDSQTAEALSIGLSTVARVRERFFRLGLEQALDPKPAPLRPQKRKLDSAAEEQLTALATSAAPSGYSRWTLKLLADRMVELNLVDAISNETIRRVLKRVDAKSQ